MFISTSQWYYKLIESSVSEEDTVAETVLGLVTRAPLGERIEQGHWLTGIKYPGHDAEAHAVIRNSNCELVSLVLVNEVTVTVNLEEIAEWEIDTELADAIVE